MECLIFKDEIKLRQRSVSWQLMKLLFWMVLHPYSFPSFQLLRHIRFLLRLYLFWMLDLSWLVDLKLLCWFTFVNSSLHPWLVVWNCDRKVIQVSFQPYQVFSFHSGLCHLQERILKKRKLINKSCNLKSRLWDFHFQVKLTHGEGNSPQEWA